MRKEFPDRTFIDDLDLGRDISIVENGRTLQALKDVYGQGKWIGLEKSIRETAKAFADPGAKASFHSTV